MSKGVREAPTKALMGDLAAESKDRVEGAFGLRQAMTTAGGLLGASLAGLAYNLSGKNYTLTFAMATIPAALALLLVTSVGLGTWVALWGMRVLWTAGIWGLLSG